MKKQKDSKKGHSTHIRGRVQKEKVIFTQEQSVKDLLLIARLRLEKCELLEARSVLTRALQIAKQTDDVKNAMEAVSGLLRLAGEASDLGMIAKWDSELDLLMQTHPLKIPVMAWYCKGMVAYYLGEYSKSQRFFHRYIRSVRSKGKTLQKGSAQLEKEESLAKGWIMIAFVYRQKGNLARAEWIAHEVIRRYASKKFISIEGTAFVILGRICESRKDYNEAYNQYQKAHVVFMSEHNWYRHLWLLHSYARLSRLQQNYSQAYWYLDLLEKAASGSEFGLLKNWVATEKSKLAEDAVDILIDSRKGLVKTRESEPLSFGKQHVLLNILEVLFQAHQKEGADIERGLSKSEIIEKVWNEKYRPESHDNKLYYNINRLRKLIEPDIRRPQHLMNWKEGYRLAPGLKVQYIGKFKQTKGEIEKNETSHS